MHPEDMQQAGFEKRELVDVISETGRVRLPVWPLDTLLGGTVALPHGWGHQSSKLTTAKQTNGVNVNILAADGVERIDPISGMANLTGIPVKIEKASGEIAPHSWSGIEKDALEIK
jgi:formate dehydrogenase